MKGRSFLRAGLLIGLALAGLVAAAPAREGIGWEIPETLRPDMSLEHPRLYYTPANLEQIRSRLEEPGADWARRIRDRIVAEADALHVMGMSEEEIRAATPPPGALFMEGWFGCICHCGAWMEAIGWEAPGLARCHNGHVLPDAEHPDPQPGYGWRDEEGYLYFFTAYWNGFVADQYSRALKPLVEAYIVTGDEKYAARAATILDALATIYPTSTHAVMDLLTGNIKEFRDPTLRPENGGDGRLDRPGYQVGRTLVWFANAADLLWDAPAFNVASPTNPALSIRDNVVYNLLLDGGDYCYHHSMNPTYIENIFNGAADYLKGQMAAGSMLGVELWLDREIEGPGPIGDYFENAIDRDGNYFETAELFSHGTKPIFEGIRDIYLGHLEMLYHLRSAKYPQGVNYWEEPRIERFYLNARERSKVAGRIPTYGDSQPDLQVIGDPEAFDREAFDHAMYLYARTTDADKRRRYAEELVRISSPLAPVERLHSFWQLANLTTTEGLEQAAGERMEQAYRASSFQGGKGLIMLRAANPRQGVYYRFGPTLNHGQPEELALQFYGDGHELSFDPGWWVIGPTFHYRVGFQLQTVAHNTVVVDEVSQLSRESYGGDLHFLAQAGSVSVSDASAESTYADNGVETYRRLVALVDVDEERAYMLDLFRVAGGQTRDYSFHGKGTRLDVEGLRLSAPLTGSVASPDYFWGDKIMGNGKIIGFRERPFSFKPAPGNGYGFLGAPRRARPEGVWSATWSDPSRLRLTMLPAAGREVIVADGPDPMGVPYLLARDRGTGVSQFVAVINPGSGATVAAKVEPLAVKGGGGTFAPVAVAVEHADGLRDIFLSTLGGRPFRAGEGRESFATDAEFAMVRLREGQVIEAHMVKGTQLTGVGLDLRADRPQVEGRILEIDYDSGRLLVEADAPLGETLLGKPLLIESEDYAHNSPYVIGGLEAEAEGRYRIQLEPDSLRLGRARISDAPTTNVLPNTMTLPAAQNVARRGGNRYFEGKLVAGERGAQTQIVAVERQRMLEVSSTEGFQAGDQLEILDARPGDRFTIPLDVHLIAH